jgi:hypothetical protein
MKHSASRQEYSRRRRGSSPRSGTYTSWRRCMLHMTVSIRQRARHPCPTRTFGDLVRCRDALEQRALLRRLVHAPAHFLAQPLRSGVSLASSQRASRQRTLHISVATSPGLTQFTRSGARSSARPRAVAGIAPVTPTCAAQPLIGRTYDWPVVTVSDCVMAPRAACWPTMSVPAMR